MDKKNYILLKDLQIYQLARKLSEIGWEIYSALDWPTKKITGDQFIESVDSVGANIAEGCCQGFISQTQQLHLYNL